MPVEVKMSDGTTFFIIRRNKVGSEKNWSFSSFVLNSIENQADQEFTVFIHTFKPLLAILPRLIVWRKWESGYKRQTNCFFS